MGKFRGDKRGVFSHLLFLYGSNILLPHQFPVLLYTHLPFYTNELFSHNLQPTICPGSVEIDREQVITNYFEKGCTRKLKFSYPSSMSQKHQIKNYKNKVSVILFVQAIYEYTRIRWTRLFSMRGLCSKADHLFEKSSKICVNEP